MNRQIEALYNLSKKSSRVIIGLMSGTSFDGLDIALCRCTGHRTDTKIELLHFETINYTADFKEILKSVFSKKQVDLEKVCLLNGWVAQTHARMILQNLEKWQIAAKEVDLIASHGQTIYHAPKLLHPSDEFGNGTLQIGDGDHLSVATGIITISDFRQKHIAAGGEGAPLAVYGDYLIFSDHRENRLMLNIGGIANFTWLPANKNPSEVFSTDVGTGNTLMDSFVQANYSNKYFDENAAIAAMGQINQNLLHQLKQHVFFSNGFPKTIGPELFNLTYLNNAISLTGDPRPTNEDIMATLNRFSADMITDAIKRCTSNYPAYTIYVSGGGMHNPLLMQHIQTQLPGIDIKDTHTLSIHPDAKEAVLFALLANETVSGGSIQLGNAASGIPAVCMGKISFPS